jgi:hypothetical protein
MAQTTQQDRERFRRIIAKSDLPISVFTERVLGRDPCTGFRYLADGEIPESMLRWLRHLVTVQQAGDELTIVMKWTPPNPRWWPHVEHGDKRSFMTEQRHVEPNNEMRHKREA